MFSSNLYASLGLRSLQAFEYKRNSHLFRLLPWTGIDVPALYLQAKRLKLYEG